MQKPDNGTILRSVWDETYQSKDSKLIFRGNLEGRKVKKVGNSFAILHPSYKNKRQSSVPQQKAVFMNFNPDKFNFSKVSNKEILFHVNLDEQEIVTKENAHKLTQKFFEQQGEDNEIQGTTHPMLINTAPLCRYHCLLAMYPEEELPQIVGQDIMLLLLNLFKVIPGVYIAYNSLGAAASVNHLHFHIFDSKELVGEQRLPLESMKEEAWLKSSLINPVEEINLYSVGVTISDIVTDSMCCMVLRPIKPKEGELDQSEAANSLSFVFGLLVNQLIELTLPHNFIATQNGLAIYVVIRDFSPVIGWLDFCGVEVTPDEKEFSEITEEAMRRRLESTKVEPETIKMIKNKVKDHLSKFI